MFLFSLSLYIYIYPRVELLDHMVVLFLVIWVVSIMLSIVIVPIFTATNSVKGFLLSASLPRFVIWGMFGDSILTDVRCYLIVVSTCFSLMIYDFEHLFMYMLALYVLGKMSIQVFCPLIIEFIVLLILNLWVVCIFWFRTPKQSYHLQIFSPVQ